MVFQNKYIWLLLLGLVVSCGGNSARYQDRSELEKPPEMKIVEKPKDVVEEKQQAENMGLGHNVSIAGSGEQPVIKIKKLFERSWEVVEQALKLNSIEITDKNREEGVFYVLFDPDAQESKDGELLDGLSFFLFKDDYEEAAYKLTLVWRDSDTEVSAELVDGEVSDILDDGEDDDISGSTDNGAILIQRLYKTIRDDLPLD